MLGEQVYSPTSLSVTYFKSDLSILQSKNYKKSIIKQNIQRKIYIKKSHSQLLVCSEIDWKNLLLSYTDNCIIILYLQHSYSHLNMQ
jgi:hypothetical protein